MTNGGLLTRDAILGKGDLAHEDVSVPEWGGHVRVRELMGSEKDAYEKHVVRMKNGAPEMHLEGARALLVSLSIVDESGQRLFTEDDVEELGRKSARALDRVYEVASRLSGLIPKAAEDAEKNSVATPSGASSSA